MNGRPSRAQREGRWSCLQKGAIMSGAPRVMILCVGNLLMSDEGFGVHAARRLERESWPPNVRVVEGGTDGFRLMNVIRDCDRLIVVDTIKGGGAPGSIYRFARDDAPKGRLPQMTSAHQVGILEVLELSELIGDVPETVFIGIEPESLAMSMELTPLVAGKMERVVELVRAEALAAAEVGGGEDGKAAGARLDP